jgi:tRNA uridine 5-carboxymethylaminomethyl modification enzyme
MGQMKTYDVIVVGCGHAGAEAILAAARRGSHCAVFCLDFDKAASMPCNPSIGGSAKGQMVGEIDAMGGVMGEAADETYLQIKVLNRSRGPAVQALRTQNDKYEYPKFVQNKIRSQSGIHVISEEVIDIIVKDGHASGVITSLGNTYLSKSVVITTGTYLKGMTHIGLAHKNEGRMGESPSNDLSDALLNLGFKLGRLKTGTPPRICATSVDFSKMTPQPGDQEFLHFSFRTKDTGRHLNQHVCYLTNTTPITHEIIKNSLDESPMYSGKISGKGPRYCPSLEDKIVRFSDKSSHHLFVEPESLSTSELYIQGFNTSLPIHAQRQILDSIDGLKDSIMLKPGYAVEYDVVYPNQLNPTLESKLIHGLFFAGQINGTSGYEEAASQGIVAGLNASKFSMNEPLEIVSRETSYIGTMIDDLTSKIEMNEPYRMMTARSEYRLLFRQDNAIFRLSDWAFQHGLLSLSDYDIIKRKKNDFFECLDACKKTNVSNHAMQKYHIEKIRIDACIRRLNISMDDVLSEFLDKYGKETVDRVITHIRYSGYIDRQSKQIDVLNRFNSMRIPDSLDYTKILGLRSESLQKLIHFRPKNIREAKSIAGINPADVMILLAHVR